MRKALYFEDALDFCDFVRLCGPDTKPAVEGQPFELCRVAHPERPGESSLVLFHCQPPLKGGLREILTHIEAEVDLSEERLFWNLQDSAHSPLTDRALGESLLEFVELQPWKKNGTRPTAGPVLFWISGADQDRANLLARLVRDSLRLGNDRIQYGPIESPASGNATLLRIESPSFFLIQACLEDHPESVQLFYPAGDTHFVRWGFSHPMETWWRQANPDPSGDWVFFRDHSDYVHVAPVIWQDAYCLADLTLNFPHRESWSESPGELPHFEVPLTLERQRSSKEAELWLLDEAGVRQLEKTLQVTDEESLRAWQIAVQRLDGNDQRDWIFVREAHAGKKRPHHEFGSLGFARYQGLNNLYLPVGFELQPPLRRDAYRDVFQLQPDTLTIIAPDDEAASSEGGFRILRVREKAFDALSSFVDHIVQRDADELKSLMSESLFDFGHYLKAPKHPGLNPENTPAARSETANTAEGEANAEPEIAPVAQSDPAHSVATTDHADKQEPDDESLLGNRQKEELQLERELVAAGQSVERWIRLMNVKQRLGKTSEAVVCAVEGLWLTRESEMKHALNDSLATLIASAFESGQDPAETATDEPESQRRAAAFTLVANRPDDREALDRWIAGMTEFLRIHDSGLRNKERWLLWGAILSVNQDLRRETQLREEIRNRITERGLSLEETPAFIRSRIYLDRNTADDPEASGGVLETARTNLLALETAALAFESPRLIRIMETVLLRARSNADDPDALDQWADHLSKPHETDDCALAWESLFRIDALRRTDPASATQSESQFADHLSRADPETVRAIRDLETLFQERAQADNPVAFLARENRVRTYPKGASTEKGLLYELSMHLEEASLAGDEPGAVQIMRTMMNLEEASEYDDPIKLPQFVEALVGGLERFKWGERGAGLIPAFENFSDRAPGFLSVQKNNFYGAILHSNLALGLLTIENREKAIAQLKRATEAAVGNAIELDFIDSAAAVIRTVEQLPLGDRTPFLEELIEGFDAHFDIENSPYISNERLFAVLVKSLNQMAETASSKDRLSREQFRHYQLQDEFLILQRIQSETFSNS